MFQNLRNELLSEYHYVQVFFRNMSFHFSPVNISSHRVKNDAYRLCLEENNHLTIGTVRTSSVNLHRATPDERGSGLQREY